MVTLSLGAPGMATVTSYESSLSWISTGGAKLSSKKADGLNRSHGPEVWFDGLATSFPSFPLFLLSSLLLPGAVEATDDLKNGSLNRLFSCATSWLMFSKKL
ncbi:hypothetical protein OGATHE_006199 [Ogataea polymorpha]|uniref:Uncharacterized protein n=1 Tax=Ogataea polymorpha TaxID=460523 RepID=A0A9P8SYZ4_9ASCO|nr:hypothetical protein OGATHE_006199 [Ogataea polymorpha]